MDKTTDDDPLSLNCNIGHFGVGAQNSAFYLAEQELVITRRRGDVVRELVLSKQALQTDYSEDPNVAYTKPVRKRAPGKSASSNLPSDAHPVLRELLKSEHERPSFTLMVLSDIKQHHRTELERLEAAASLQRPLALADMPFLRQVRAGAAPGLEWGL